MMTEAEARAWLNERGLRPFLLGEGSQRQEGRWYPAAEDNLAGEFFKDDKSCLLPVEVYDALEFQKPDGWGYDDPYPWFYPYEAAIEAAVKAVMLVIQEYKPMQVDIETLISASRIAPGDKLYIVVLPNGHDTLKRGDVVKVCECGGDNLFIRVADLTAHKLKSDGEYVAVVEKR